MKIAPTKSNCMLTVSFNTSNRRHSLCAVSVYILLNKNINTLTQILILSMQEEEVVETIISLQHNIIEKWK